MTIGPNFHKDEFTKVVGSSMQNREYNSFIHRVYICFRVPGSYSSKVMIGC